MAALALALLEQASPEEIAGLVVEHARMLTASPQGYAAFLDPATGYLISPLPSQAPDIWDQCQVEDGNTICREPKGLHGWVLREGQALLSNDPSRDPRAEGVPARGMPLSRLLCVPALAGGRLLGQVAVANAPRDYTPRDQETLSRLAGLYALALERAQRGQGQETRLNLERQAALLELSRMLDAPLKDICDYALEAGVRLTGSELGYLYFMSEDQTTLTVYSWSRQAYEQCGVPGQPSVYQVQNTGLWGEAVRQGRPIVTNDYAAPNPYKRGIPEGHVPLRRHMNLPVMEGGRVMAVAGVANKEGPYDEGDVRQLQLIMDSLWGLVQRKRVQEALRRSEELFRQMFEANKSVKLVIDPADGAIVRANQAACDFYGYSQEEFAGLDIRRINLLPPAQVDQEMRLALEGAKSVFEFTHRLASGEVRLVEVYSGPISLEGRTLLYSIIHDITERRQAQEALRASEAKFATAFQASPVVMSISTLQDGRFLEVNDTYARLSGYTREELIGRTGLELGIWADAQERARVISSLLATGQIRDMDLKVRTKSGQIRQILYSADRIQVDGQDCLLSVGVDVSERQRAKQALKQSEERFRLLYEDAPMPYQSLDEDGLFLDVNRAWLEALGYEKREVLGKWFGSFLAPGFIPHFEKNFPCFKEAGRVEGVEFDMLRRDGSTILVTFNGKVAYGPDGRFLRTHCIFQDITERRRAERALAASESSYRALAANLPGMVYRLELGREGRVQFFNDMLQVITGYQPEELAPGGPGGALEALIAPKDREAVRATLKQALKTGQPFEVEYRLRTKDDQMRTVWERGRPVADGEGRPLYIDGVILDATEHHLLQEQARLAQKLESLAIMAGGVAHDFNNLLQTVLGNADLALLDLPPASRPAEHLREVQQASQRAAELAHKMLAYSGHTPFIARPLDLRALLADMLPALKGCLPPGVDLECSLPPEVPPLQGDENQLRQAVRNLVVNAGEALGPQGGRVTISLGQRDCDRAWLGATYLDSNLPEGRYVTLEVADNGPGMNGQTAARAFDPFFTTKFPGRGLGLSVTLGVLRGHHGAVRLESAPGQGTRVTLCLPFAQFLEAAAQPRAAGQPSQGRVLLLAEGERSVGLVARRMLEKHGYQVEQAGTIPQALDRLAGQGPAVQPAIVDVDQMVPPWEAMMGQLLAARPGLRLVILSGLEPDAVAERLGGVRPVGILQKPFRMADLISLVTRAREEQPYGS